MVENQKSPDVKKEASSKPTGVELPHVQEVRKLDGAAKQVQDIKRKQEIAQGKKLHEGEKEDAGENLLQGFNAEPGELVASPKPKENFVESSEVKDARELDLAKSAYQGQLKKTYETHIGELKDKPEEQKKEEQKKVGQEYLGRCVKDLQINPEKIGNNDVKVLAETLPKAWKETLFNPELSKNPALKKISNKIIADCMKCPRAPGSTEEQFQKVLLEHVKKTTGIDSLTLDDIKLLQEKRKKSYDETEKIMGQKQPNESESEYASRTVDSAATNGTGEATLGEAVTSGDTAGYSGEVGKPLSENAAETAKKIKEVFKDKPELHKFIDRHAGNNTNFSAQKPFLMQNLSAQRAYIYYPGAEKPVECSATHGVKGISNTNNSHGTSLGSKELVPDTNDDRGNKIKIRTAIKGLESCNSNDFSRDIRVHEQHGAKTWGCTGLPMEAMVKFDAAIDAAGGGAMEVFTV